MHSSTLYLNLSNDLCFVLVAMMLRVWNEEAYT